MTRGGKRVDSASRVIKATPQTIYEAFVDPAALVSWLPPKGMKARLDTFNARPGGAYRMELTYDEAGHETPGKSSENSDIVEGKFLELVPNERVVHAVEFQSDIPAFAGTMKMTWALLPAPGGTEVTITCENVPEGIQPDDHAVGLKSSLENLANFCE